jgi:multiple sugar transport system substrate-binding protein
MKPTNPHPRSLGRRELLGLTALGAAGLLLPACSSSAADGGDVDLTFWLPGGEDGYLALHEELGRTYSKQHPNVHVEVKRLTGDQNFIEVLLARIAAGDPPTVTVLWEPPVGLGHRGALMELDEFLPSSRHCQLENWPSAVLKSCQFDGKTYGLPFTAGSYGIFYNQEWFEEKGIPSDRDSFPKTWDDLRALSKEFTRWDGDQLETAGFLLPFDPVTLPIWSGLNGGQLFDAENRKYLIDSEPNVEMFEYFMAWLDEEYKGDINKVNESWTSLGEEPPIFQMKRLAMLPSGTWLLGSFYNVEAEFERWEIAGFPVGPSGDQPVSGYWPNWIAIPRDSNDPEAGFAYVDMIAVEGAQAQFEEFPDLPTNADVDPDIVPAKLVARRGEEFARDAVGFMRHQLEISVPMWQSPVHTFATDQLTRAIERISTKTGTPKAELQAAQQACQAELDKVL